MFQIKRREPITGNKFILLDANKCEACWECISVCKQKAIGKIDLFIHKHARIANTSLCSGCMKCIKACLHGAITRKEILN